MYIFKAFYSCIIRKDWTMYMAQPQNLDSFKPPSLDSRALKGGCTRFEVEHLSCNLLLYIGIK